MATVPPPEGITSHDMITRLRREAGDYVNGRWVDGALEDPNVDINCSLQPPNRKGSVRIINELGGDRIQDWRIVYCAPQSLRGADDRTGLKADRFLYFDATYEVRHVNPWRGQVLRHDEVFAVRIDTSSAPTNT